MSNLHHQLVLIFSLVFILPQYVMVADKHAVYKSDDRGQTWHASSKGLAMTHRIHAMSISGNLLLAATDGGIYRSINAAQTWESTDVTGRVISVAGHGEIMFAGLDNLGLIRSEDQGKSWRQVASYPANKVRCFLSHNDKLYTGTDRNGVLFSVDSGKNWIPLAKDFPEGAQVFSLSQIDGQLFAALYQNGLHFWSDFDKAWNKSGPVTPLAIAAVADTLVVGHNPGGLYWSEDAGLSWHKGHGALDNALDVSVESVQPELAHDAPVWEMASSGDLVMAGAASGIYVSEDKGHTWTLAKTGLPSDSPGVSFLLTDHYVLAGVIVRE